jgi:hypothetical protein
MDALTTLEAVGIAITAPAAAIGLPAAVVGWFRHHVHPWVHRRWQQRQIRLIVDTAAHVHTAVESVRRPARYNVHCRAGCGRFAKKLAGGEHWAELVCAKHGHHFWAEKLIGEFEPAPVVHVSQYRPIVTLPVLSVDTAPIPVLEPDELPEISVHPYTPWGGFAAVA